MAFSCVLAILIAAGAASAAGADYDFLDRAYSALSARDYDRAISQFREAIALAPDRAATRADLAYTYLKAGETELARDQFAEALRLDPGDEHIALEYAFLCYETKQQATARRLFDRIRKNGNAVAERAFQNIDRQLAEGIARWKMAVELSPDNYSAHQELARLAEHRDDLALAAQHYHRAWRLRPELRAFLLDLGRVWQLDGKTEQANAALLAASRGAEPRVAETARSLLPARYPYVYEFDAALELDPGNLELRRELAYLHLEMGAAAEAEAEFRRITEADGSDALSQAQLGLLLLARKELVEGVPLLQKALQTADDELADRIRSALGLPRTLRKRADVPRSQTSAEARLLAERSLEAGYLKDALKYLRIAHENDPVDFNVILKLGWTNNILKDDRQALEWFRLARKSPDTTVSIEAKQAYKSLHPEFARIRTSVWMYPVYSTRWKDLFTYAQLKTELLPNRSVQLYFSTRFSGDTRRTLKPELGGAGPQYLSENAGIFAAGVSTRPWKGMRAWVESGIEVSYLRREDTPRKTADHRGGISALSSLGKNIGAASGGFFAELSGDAVFLSRFENDFIGYLRSRSGYTLKKAGGTQLQLCWNLNTTADSRRFQWANTVEAGPGLRLHLSGLSRPLLLTADALSGRHTALDGTRPPAYSDFRIGIWYAFSR